MGIRQRLVSLGLVLSMSVAWTSTVFAQEKSESSTQATSGAKTAASGASKASSKASAGSSKSNCPAPTPDVENATRLRTLSDVPPATVKKFKVRLDKGGNSIGLPAPANESAPAATECFFVLAENQKDVVAEIAFQKLQKNSRGVSVWVFTPVRRSAAGKSTVNLSIVRAEDVLSKSAGDGAAGDLLPAENPIILPSFLLIQNASHQGANVRSGVSLNIPVSGFGASIEAFVPKLKSGAWTNMFGIRLQIANWSAEKFSFKKPVSNEIQEASATGSNMQIDVALRYPLNFKYLPRIGLFVSPVSVHTEILKVSAGATSPANTQTVTRSGLLLGAETEIQPAENFFLGGRVTMSFKETVTVKDESEPGDKLSGAGTATRLHLTGLAGVRLPLIASKRFVFEGCVGNSLRTDKYSEEVAYAGQSQQKDIVTFFQAGFGYIL